MVLNFGNISHEFNHNQSDIGINVVTGSRLEKVTTMLSVWRPFVFSVIEIQGWTLWYCFFTRLWPSDTCHMVSSISVKVASTNGTVLKIRTICHAQDLWKLAPSCKQLQLLCLLDQWNSPSTALLSEREREREIKFIGLFEDRGHWGPYSPYKPF